MNPLLKTLMSVVVRGHIFLLFSNSEADASELPENIAFSLPILVGGSRTNDFQFAKYPPKGPTLN